jgi:hypothetical protein
MGSVQVQSGLRQVPTRSQAGLGQVLPVSWAGLGRIRRFENEMRKLIKWFTIFKTVNYFPKIKEKFSIKRKIFSTDYYFTSQ